MPENPLQPNQPNPASDESVNWLNHWPKPDQTLVPLPKLDCDSKQQFGLVLPPRNLDFLGSDEYIQSLLAAENISAAEISFIEAYAPGSCLHEVCWKALSSGKRESALQAIEALSHTHIDMQSREATLKLAFTEINDCVVKNGLVELLANCRDSRSTRLLEWVVVNQNSQTVADEAVIALNSHGSTSSVQYFSDLFTSQTAKHPDRLRAGRALGGLYRAGVDKALLACEKVLSEVAPESPESLNLKRRALSGEAGIIKRLFALLSKCAPLFSAPVDVHQQAELSYTAVRSVNEIFKFGKLSTAHLGSVISLLGRMLGSSEFRARAEAVEALGLCRKRGFKVLNSLVLQLRHGNRNGQMSACDMLRKEPLVGARPALSKLLSSPDEGVCEEAWKTILEYYNHGMLSSEGIESFVSLYYSASDSVAAKALKFTARIDNFALKEGIHDYVYAELNKRPSQVKSDLVCLAIDCIGHEACRSQRTASLLREASMHPDPQISRKAAEVVRNPGLWDEF